MKRALSSCLLACLMLVPGLAAAASSPCEGVELRMGVSLLGAAFFVSDGRPQGIDADIGRELSRRTGSRVSFVDMNRRRISLSLEQGVFIEMTGLVGHLPERDRGADFVALHRAAIYLLVHRRLAREAGYSLQDFIGDPRLRIGSFVGSTAGPDGDAQLALLAAQGRVVQSAQTAHAIARLLAGRVDGMLATALVFGPALRDPASGGDIRVIPVPDAAPLVSGLYLSRQRLAPACRRQIAETLRMLREDGTLERIYRRHLGEEMRRGQIALLPFRPARQVGRP